MTKIGRMDKSAPLQKIKKNEARKMYEDGKSVYLVPNKVSPYNVWGIGCWVQKVDDRTFDAYVNEFEAYSCNRELGLYCAYYVEA